MRSSQEMDILLLLIRIILFAVFAAAGIGKLMDLAGSEKAVKDFGVPEKLAKFVSIVLPIAELSVALLLIFTTTSWFGAVGAFLLLAVFIGGMIWQMKQGNAPDCHCFGAIHSEPVSRKSLLRNVVIAVFAFLLIVQGWHRQGLSFAEMSNEIALGLILGLAVIGTLAAAVFYLKKISEQQTQIIRRIEILEVISHDGAEVEREDVALPASGLPIGAPAPDFVLPDVSGREVAFEDLLSKAKPIVFFFVSPTCSPCRAMLPEIENWQRELSDKINFVFVSSGSAAENTAKMNGVTEKQILLQKDKEVALLFGAQWTPTAILINSDGTIASQTAVGDAAIRELFAGISAANVEDGMIFVKNENGAEQFGAQIPEFAVADTNGETISAENLIGKKTLLTYWGLDCGWCGQMLEDLRDWDQRRGADEPELLLVSSGSAERNRNLGLRAKILLDEEGVLPNNLGMTGTPSAILINEHGKIVSEIAVGAEDIWSLVGREKNFKHIKT